MTGEEWPPCDEPHDYVILVDPITIEQAQSLGKVLGSEGFTGVFLDGPLAYHMRQYERLKNDYQKLAGQTKGGEADG